MSSLLTRTGGVSSQPDQVPDPVPPDHGFPRVGVAEAVRRSPRLAAAPVLILVVLALAYGVLQAPTYTAQSYQSIGRIDISEPGALSGFQQATETLATTYSRAINSSKVVDVVAERAGMTPQEVRKRLAAYPIPESSVFVVAATGSSSEAAISLADRGARALRSYIRRLNADNPNGRRLYRQFRRAAYQRSRLQDRLDARKAQYRAGGGPSAAQKRALARLESRVDAARLRRDVAERNYAASRSGDSTIALVQSLVRPETATSDRFERLQLLLFIALSVGVLLGLALATLRANRDVRRALSRS